MAARRWFRLSAAEWFASLAVLVASAFIVQPLTAQSSSRMALTASLAEHGTVRIDRFEGGALNVDFAAKDGHLYSDKAPAQPVLAVGPYLAYKAVGGDSAEVFRRDFNLGLWWISVWSAALPAAALVVVMARLARPWNERWAMPAALAMSMGSLLLPFGTVLFSHTASALLIGGALLMWRRTPPRRSDLVTTGALLGLAIAVEYTSVVALAVVGLASLARDRWGARWLTLGAAVPLAAVAGYHWIAFGGPLEVPYRYHNLGLHNSAAAGLAAPTPDRVWTLLTSGRGVFLLTPIVLVGFIGLLIAAKERPARRVELGVILAVFVGFFLVQAGADDLTGGDSLGPRYVIPALPGLVIGVATLWPRRPTLCAGVAVISTGLMLVASYTNPLVPPGSNGHLRYWADLIGDGDWARTIVDPFVGRAGIPIILLGAAWLARLALRADLSPPLGARASDP